MKAKSLIFNPNFSEHKKLKVPIKKKSEQISRLRKKAKKDIKGGSGSLMDPSVQRLIEQSSRDLNTQYKQLHGHQKNSLRKIISEERLRYCNIVASLKPIIGKLIQKQTARWPKMRSLYFL